MRPLFILLLYALALFASPVDSRLVGPDALMNYERYLAMLKKDGNESVEEKLKRSLLYKLINITKYAKEEPPQTVNREDLKSSEDFLEAFKIVIKQEREVEKLKDSLREIQERASYLKRRIETEDEKSSVPGVEELQYAFYFMSADKLKKRVELLKKALIHNDEAVRERLPYIKFDTQKSLKREEELEKRLESARMKLENLKIERERLQLLGREKRADSMQREIAKAESDVDKITEEIIDTELVRYFNALQSKDAHLFKIEERVAKLVDTLSAREKSAYLPLLRKLGELSAQRLGKTRILLHRTKEGIVMIEKDLWQKMQIPLFTINEKPISSWDLLVALFILVAGFTIAGLYRRYIRRITDTFINVTPSNQIIVSNLGYYLILTIAFFIMLKSMGLDLTSLTLIAGALSVGIGFGLQNIVANFISGIILLFEKSIKIGDFLEISDKLRGRVVDIHMRSITIRTNDNIDILVPNQTFIQNDVINWTLSDSQRRMRIPFGVAYGTDIKKVKTAVLEALQNSSLHFIRDDDTKQPLVVMTEMGNSSVNFELFVWVEGDETLKPLRTADKFLVLIYNTLYENGIEIPFPQLDLHVRDIKDKLVIKQQE